MDLTSKSIFYGIPLLGDTRVSHIKYSTYDPFLLGRSTALAGSAHKQCAIPKTMRRNGNVKLAPTRTTHPR